ncbi:MAG: DUF192 domain-containing protein [Pseudomonadota bacterium]
MRASDERETRAYGRRAAKLGICALALSIAALAADACTPNSLVIKDDDSEARFSVEVADTMAERGRGLMFREELPLSAGMLFVYGRPRSVSFWMRNTLIPLDMLFITSDGTVARIHENAIPLDETAIFGGNNIQYVLEINGGLARQLGLEVGSVIQHPSIDQARAAFPCE